REGEQDERDPEKDGIDLEPFSEAAAHAADLAVGTRKMQPLQGAGLALRAAPFGDHDPQDEIGERPEPAEKERHQKEQAEEDRVEIEIIAESGADAGDLPVFDEPIEFLHVTPAIFPANE